MMRRIARVRWKEDDGVRYVPWVPRYEQVRWYLASYLIDQNTLGLYNADLAPSLGASATPGKPVIILYTQLSGIEIE